MENKFNHQPEQNGLTSQANSPKLEKRGDIFMTDQGETPRPGGEDLAKAPLKRSHAPTPNETVEHLARIAQVGVEDGLGGEQQGLGARESRLYIDPHQEQYMSAVKSLAEGLRPEFSVAVRSSNTPIEAYEGILTQYAELRVDVEKRLADVPDVDDAAELRKALIAEEAKLRADFKNTMEALGQASPDRTATADEKAAVTAIMNMPEDDTIKSALKHEAIRAYLQTYFQNNSVADNPLPNEILRLIAQDEAATERFVSDLIVMELENEPWQIKGFYGNINLEKFLKVVRNEWDGTHSGDIAKRDRLTTLIDANRGFHDMNYILRRNFDQFAQQSEVIQPAHLRVLSQIPGVSEGIALYEEFYTAERAREGYITEAAAKQIDFRVEEELGRLAKASHGENAFLITGVDGGQMQAWEVYRAHVYARDTFRILMRAVEQTSLSDLPPGNKKFTTIALGKVAMIFDTLKFNGLRFSPAQQAGGPELLDRTLENMRKKRRGTWEKGGRVKVRLARVGGTDVGLMEFQSIVAARGVLATWRAGEAVLAETRFTDNGEITDITTFFTTHKEQIERLKEREGRGEDVRADVKRLFQPLLDGTSINLGLMASGFGISPPETFKELVWEKIALEDPLVMAQLLTGAEVDSEVAGNLSGLRSLQDILVRTWGTPEQTAALIGVEKRLKEIDAMTGEDRKTHEAERVFLHNQLQVLTQKRKDCERELADKEKNKNPTDEEKQRIDSLRAEKHRSEFGLMGVGELRAYIGGLEEIDVAQRTDDDRLRLDVAKQELGKKNAIIKQILTGEQWNRLTETLRTKHRMRMSDEVARITRREGETDEQFIERLSKAPKSLDEYLKDTEGEEPVLSEQERQVVNAIRENGTRIAPDLARIKRAYAWFLDDVPFQSINWEVLGQFYDREVNDLGGFSKSAQALTQVVNNPFGVTPEKILDSLGEAVVAAGGILNEDASQDNIQPFFETYLEMIDQTTNRQLIVTEVMHQLNKPTSRAQEIAGVLAPSVNEAGMRTILEESLPKHVTRKSGRNLRTGDSWTNTQQKLINHFRATPWRVFGWRNLRDFGPLGLLFFVVEFLNESFRPKQQG